MKRKKRDIVPASNENLEPLLKSLFWLGLAAYIMPLLLIGGVLIGAGIGIGYLIWG